MTRGFGNGESKVSPIQFVREDPDVPESLLQAPEEGRVVFLCGIGMSYPADLPGLAELVDDLYSCLEVIPIGSGSRDQGQALSSGRGFT